MPRKVHIVSFCQNVTSNHRANDTVVCEGRPQVLNGRFMYGPLDVVTLTGEKVSTQKAQPLVIWALPPVPGTAPDVQRLSP